MFVLVSQEQPLILALKAHLVACQLLHNRVAADLWYRLERCTPLANRLDLLEEALRLAALDLGLRQIRLERRQPFAGHLLLILGDVEVRLLRVLVAVLLGFFQVFSQWLNFCQQGLDRAAGRPHGDIDVPVDVALGNGIDPERNFLRIRALQAQFDDAGVFDGLHLNHLREGSNGIVALSEHRVIVEIEAIEDPLRDVPALDDLVLCVEVALFSEPAVAAGADIPDISDRCNLAGLGVDFNRRHGEVGRLLGEGADGDQRQDHDEDAQHGPASTPDNSPVVEKMNFALVFYDRRHAVRHAVILSPKPCDARALWEPPRKSGVEH